MLFNKMQIFFCNLFVDKLLGVAVIKTQLDFRVLKFEGQFYKACVVCACLSSLESKVEGGKESLANHRRLYTCIFSERVTLNKIMQSEQPLHSFHHTNCSEQSSEK
jgi:hypothetical protein